MYHTQSGSYHTCKSSPEDDIRSRYSNHFRLNISRQQPGAISCKWLCNAAKNDALSPAEISTESRIRSLFSLCEATDYDYFPAVIATFELCGGGLMS